MKLIRSEDLFAKVFGLFDQYVHSQITRREFADRVSKYAAGGLTAAAILSCLSPNYAKAVQIELNDKRIRSKYITYSSPKGAGKMRGCGYLVLPAESKSPLPGVVVVHEKRGLNPHLEGVVRGVGLAGFIAFAPDALRDAGGLYADYEWLAANKECTGRVGVAGFCFGGRIANMIAVGIPGLSAAAPFYRGQLPEDEAPKIKAPLLLHFAEEDPRVTTRAGPPAQSRPQETRQDLYGTSLPKSAARLSQRYDATV